MPDRSPATRASVAAATMKLSGAFLTSVTYCGWGDDSWDHGTYHEATMGVELVSADGTSFVACWGDAFGHFGLELHAGRASDTFENDPEMRDFSTHDWWAPFARSPVSGELLWRAGFVDDGLLAPVALALTSGQHCVWIADAAPNSSSRMSLGGFLLGMDEVIVTSDRRFAESIGLTMTSASP